MAGGHGGRREGSGRKPGSQNKLTKEAAAALERARVTAGDDTSPLDVMAATMRALWRAAHTDPESGKPLPKLDMKKALDAHSVAKDVAPYMHPKLQSIEGVPDKPLVIKDEASTFEKARRVAFLLVRGAQAADAQGKKKPTPQKRARQAA